MLNVLSHLAAFTVAAVLLPLVGATDICAYTSRSCLPVTFGCCYNIPAGQCCEWGQASGYGYSIKWQNNAGPWFGRAYAQSYCGVQAGGLGASSGDGCLNRSGTALNWASARWEVDGLKVAGEVGESGQECRTADVFGYTDSEGKVHAYRVPEDRVQEAIDLIEKEAFTGLEVFEAVDFKA